MVEIVKLNLKQRQARSSAFPANSITVLWSFFFSSFPWQYLGIDHTDKETVTTRQPSGKSPNRRLNTTARNQ
jgi:hypothetical protein